MKSLIFDSGPIISLAMNNLLWLLEPLKRNFVGKFYVTPAVKHELVDRPLQIKRFGLEALQISRVMNKHVIELLATDVSKRTKKLLEIANKCYKSKSQYIRIVQDAEIEVLATACELGECDAVIDERTVRLLVENPEDLRKLLEVRLHRRITMDKRKVREFQSEVCQVNIIRSSELVAVAFKLDLFSELTPNTKSGKEIVLDAALWGVKSQGCGISKMEIQEIKKILLK
jgi:hypothetical protein